MTSLAPHLTDYLVDHLPRHRSASPHTVATYAHSFTLLVRFAADRRRLPTDVDLHGRTSLRPPTSPYPRPFPSVVIVEEGRRN